MRTRVCEPLGVEFPILAFSHCRDVVASVTRAGGFGVLGAAGHTPEQLDIDLAWIGQEVKGRPFGVDVIVPAKYLGDTEGGLSASRLQELIPQAHRDFLARLLDKYEVPALPDDDRRERQGSPFSLTLASRQMDVAFSHDIKLIANALGPPPGEMIERARGAGVVVAALAGKKDHALRHVAAGADLIIAQGYEAGGHTGEIATMVLVPEVVDAVAAAAAREGRDVPVVAAGGIGGGRQLAAALALGADGVWCGSVWLTTEEAETHPTVKTKFLQATSSDTVRSRARTGNPARPLRSAWTDEWAGPSTPGPLGMPLQPVLIAEAEQRVQRAALNPSSKAAELSGYFVGQIVGSMNRVTPSARVVLEMVDELIDAVQRLNGMLS
jgi:NAD(P)H-dependent flavin oxidoreductase YrpB (nitropropane dioxygenase family)